MKTNIATWQAGQGHDQRPLDQAMAEVVRECQVRSRCFDRWVADGKMEAVDAVDRMERLLSALRYLREHEAALVPA